MRRRWTVSVLHATTKYAHGLVLDLERPAERFNWICSGIGMFVRDSTGAIVSPVPGGMRLAINRVRRAAVKEHIAKLTEARGG